MWTEDKQQSMKRKVPTPNTTVLNIDIQQCRDNRVSAIVARHNRIKNFHGQTYLDIQPKPRILLQFQYVLTCQRKRKFNVVIKVGLAFKRWKTYF